jgi:hypothetical protein
LYNVVGAKSVVSICREWLTDTQLDWYARAIAARIYAKFLLSMHILWNACANEQSRIANDGEETSILRQEFSHGAFQKFDHHKNN